MRVLAYCLLGVSCVSRACDPEFLLISFLQIVLSLAWKFSSRARPCMAYLRVHARMVFGMVDGKISLLVPHVCIFEFPFFYFPVLVSMMYIYSCLYIEKSCSGLHSTKNLLSLVCIFEFVREFARRIPAAEESSG